MNCNTASPFPFRRFRLWLVLPVCMFTCALPAGLFAQTVAFTGVLRTLGSGFSDPGGVVVDGSGDVYVADEINNAVYELVAVGGSIPASPTIRTLGSGFHTPASVAVDASGNVFVADAGNNAVKEIVAVGGSIPASPTIRTLGSGFSRPTGVAVDGSGNVYVADFDNGLVKEMAAVGGSIPGSPTIRRLASGFSGPIGVAVDGSGNVYVADYQSNAVSEILAVGGSIPASPTVKQLGGNFNEPSSVAVDGSGNVYVSDVGDSAVYEILAVGGSIPASPTIETLGGGFSGPNGVTVDGSGNVYVADTLNSAVKEILAPGASFGSENLASTSVSLSLQLKFVTSSLGVTAEVLTEGTPGLDFADAGTGSCTTNGPGRSYSAGDFCSVDVTFAPRYAGLRRGALLVFNSENGDLLASVPIYGVGIGPQIGFVSGAAATVGSELIEPVGVAVDGAGDVFIGEPISNRVVEAPADGGPQTIVADGLNYPWQIAIDGAGDVFIADSGNGRVLKVPAGGALPTTVGSGLAVPYGVAVDGAGNVFIADNKNNNVVEVPANGSAQIVLATGIYPPEAIAVDSAGDLFIVTEGGAVVDELVPGNSSLLPVGTGFQSPVGVAVDGAGDVFVGDYSYKSLIELPAGGGANILLGNNGFNLPSGVAVDGAGDLFVTEVGSNRVVELPYSRPPSLTFGSSGGVQTVTLENVGNRSLVLPGILQGTNPALSNSNFVLNTTSATACAVVTANSFDPGRLAPGQTCDLTITFSPTNGGTQSGTLVLTDNSLNASPTVFTPQTIPLSGTASSNLPDITWPSPAAISYGTALSTTQLNATANVAGTLSYTPAAGTVLGVGAHTLSATFTPTNTTSYTTATTTVTLTVNQAVPAITWTAPAAISYGAELSTAQLDATSPVAGKFVYEPPAGTGFPAGTQTLSVTFTPTDTADYATVSDSVELTVNKDSQTISFTQPASPVVYGVAPVTLSAAGGASGNPVTFSLVSGPGTLSGVNDDILTVTGAGTIVVAANQAGNSNYAAAAQVTRTVMVTGAGNSAVMISPTAGSTFAGPSVTFNWSAATGATAYSLWLGTTGVGSNNLWGSGATTATSLTFGGMPTNGEKIYVRLWTNLNGSSLHEDYIYTTATQAVMTSPTAGSAFTSSTVTFSWTPGIGASAYAVWLGSAGVGSNNLGSSGGTTSTSFIKAGLPTNGETIYVRLWTTLGGISVHADYTYIAATQSVMTSPAQGSTFAAASETFTWTASTGATSYSLWLGSTGVGSNNLAGSGATTATSFTKSGLPTNGETIYVRLWTTLGGVSVYADYKYTAATMK